MMAVYSRHDLQWSTTPVTHLMYKRRLYLPDDSFDPTYDPTLCTVLDPTIIVWLARQTWFQQLGSQTGNM